MNAWVVLDAATLDVVFNYISEASQKNGYSGYLNTCHHIEVPEGLDPQCTRAVKDTEGTITLQEDPAKVQAKLDAQWTAVRTQQRQKLYESDWTCSVTDYEVPDRELWVQYRAQLRDVTLQSDPFAIVWPVAPV
jgi:hypothetical protein